MVGMASYRAAPGIFCALLLCLDFLMVSSQSPTVAPSPTTTPSAPVTAPPSPAALPPPAIVPAPAPAAKPQPQVVDMIEALRDAGQFGAIAGLLDGLQMKNLTPMTTWLLPNDEAFSGTSYPKNVTKFIDYHVIRQLLPYSRLSTLSVGTRLPTFLGSETVVVTSNLRFNYSLDNAMIVVPDLYSDSTVAVHGINSVLNDYLFNEGVSAPSPGEAPSGVPTAGPPSPPSSSSSPTTPGESNPITLPAAAPTLSTSTSLPVSFGLILIVAMLIV
ncbi:hypothetical protein MPTK2_1g16270 [Marchantia polymorpha subsp. ruderalis]